MKIAILGAAGVRTPLIIRSFAGRAKAGSLNLDELSLMDIDGERLELIGALTAPLEHDLPFHITRTTDAAAALQGADFVITTFRVGGIESRVVDERVPLSLGVLGQETTGPGGFAMGMRTIPVLVDYVHLMEQLCPHAWLINFANPAGMLAEAVLRLTGWQRVVGICDGPSGMQRMAAELLDAPVEEVFLDYFGLNHLGWARAVIYRGEDYLPRFLDLLDQGELHGLPFDPRLVRSLGMIPNEYLHYYYNAQGAVRNILQAEQSRGEQVSALNQELFARLRRRHDQDDQVGMQQAYASYLQARGESYMAAETGREVQHAEPAPAGDPDDEGYAGVALDLIQALRGEKPRLMILNIANQGAVHGMEAADVVEIPAFVSRDLVLPIAVGAVPAQCLGLMQQVKAYERLTIRAAAGRSYDLAVEALTIHPLVRDFSLARRILDGYLQGHGTYFPTLEHVGPRKQL